MPIGFRKLVRLNMSANDVNNFVIPDPYKGLDIVWHDYDYYNNQVTASITGMEWCPENKYDVYKEKVDDFISGLPVAQDGIKSSKYPLNTIRTITTYTDLVNGQFDHLLSKSKVNNAIIDGNQLKEAEKLGKIVYEKFYDNCNRKRYKVQTGDMII